MKRLLGSCFALGLVASGPAVAGQCTADIEITQTNFDLRIHTAAATGPDAVETTAAKLHHQPTEGSVGQAETQLGDVPPAVRTEFGAAMQRARAADTAGNNAACEQALAQATDAIKAIKP